MKSIFILLFFFITITSYAQPRFVLQNETATVFTNINDAIVAANAGDTLYIPGGNYVLSNPTITKPLHWIGVGHYPSATTATNPTKIVTGLTFNADCSGSSFEGIYFSSNISFGTGSADATGITIKRCRIDGQLALRVMTSGTPLLYDNISECVLSIVTGNHASNCLIEKSIITGEIRYFESSQVKFNSINTSSTNVVYYCTSVDFYNNIFGNKFGSYYSNGCNFYYNLFAVTYTNWSTHTADFNIFNVGSANIYASITGDISSFSYDNDYHLKAGSSGIDEYGKDSIGVYGSVIPYKENAIPFYPHIQALHVDDSATDGKIGVQITVTAQDR